MLSASLSLTCVHLHAAAGQTHNTTHNTYKKRPLTRGSNPIDLVHHDRVVRDAAEGAERERQQPREVVLLGVAPGLLAVAQQASRAEAEALLAEKEAKAAKAHAAKAKKAQEKAIFEAKVALKQTVGARMPQSKLSPLTSPTNSVPSSSHSTTSTHASELLQEALW